MPPFVAYVLSLMLSLAATEVPAPFADSYDETATAIATAAEARHLPGATREQTAAVLVTMSWRESRFNPDAVGDSGSAHGLFQIHAGTLGRPVPEDAQGQTWAAMELLGTSFAICKDRPLANRLGWYLWGRAGCSHRLEMSASRMHEASRLLLAHPAPQ